LNLVDIATSWCEPAAIGNRGREEVARSLVDVKGGFPFRFWG